MAPLLGYTRTQLGARHALLTADAQSLSPSVGIAKGRVASLISPQLGASFLQWMLHFDGEDGSASLSENDLETFFYILEGSCTVDAGPAQVKRISGGGYLFIPAGHACTLSGPEPHTRILVFQKKFRPILGEGPLPRLIVGRSGQVQGNPYLGDPDTRMQVLLPEEPTYDMTASLFTFQPGASLPSTGIQGVESGLLLLHGQGIFRIEDAWYPVKEGDVLWIGAHSPHWFVATGKTPAIYLVCRPSNRLPTLDA